LLVQLAEEKNLWEHQSLPVLLAELQNIDHVKQRLHYLSAGMTHCLDILQINGQINEKDIDQLNNLLTLNDIRLEQNVLTPEVSETIS
jgi:hypothetical protein